jgi:hypothetical protein
MDTSGRWAWVAIALFSVFLITAGESFAGDQDTTTTGGIQALDANQGSGTQVNADTWEDIGNSVAGDGSQSSDTDGSSNTGSGSQNSSSSNANSWKAVDNANNGSGEQIDNSGNSNGNDRLSNDLIIGLGHDGSIADSALDATVSGNAILAQGSSANLDANLSIDSRSGFDSMAGINAVAATSAANSSQNVGVNVTASVSTNPSSF